MEDTIFSERLQYATFTQFTQHLVSQSYMAGQIIFSQDQQATGLYIIKQGSVFIFRQSHDKRQVLALLKVGDCFGGESAVNQAPPPYTARAVTATELLWLSPEHLMYYLQNHPDFLSLFLSLITKRLRQFTVLVHDLAFRDVPARLATVLLMFAESYGQIQDEGIYVPHIVSQSELAEMVGTAREVIYRALKQFECEGILKKDKNTFLIYDMPALREVAQAETK